jgi:hypothetical protein
MSNHDRAIRMRDLARSVLRARGGDWLRTNVGPILSLDAGSLRLVYRTPFQKLPLPSQELKYWAAADGAKIENLPYGLDIWVTGQGKVLNIEWSDAGAIELISFRPGDWEMELERLGTGSPDQTNRNPQE